MTLWNFVGQGIDFEKRKVYKSFRPGHSKYIDIVDHRVCWNCGCVGHFRHSCSKRRHVWQKFVPSNVECSMQVQKHVSFKENPQTKKLADRPGPQKQKWVWVPKSKWDLLVMVVGQS